ncbi:DUF3426 domain-containing protein [Alcaligenaceae bacterium]|nr:DUF3426 domain-containing protein [Alcaligenaceae bacterium]
MELTTRCPQCETVFSVSLEQLQLRKGYIRCIQCAHIFDGFEAVVPSAARPGASIPAAPMVEPTISEPAGGRPAAEPAPPHSSSSAPSPAEPRIPPISEAGPAAVEHTIPAGLVAARPAEPRLPPDAGKTPVRGQGVSARPAAEPSIGAVPDRAQEGGAPGGERSAGIYIGDAAPASGPTPARPFTFGPDPESRPASRIPARAGSGSDEPSMPSVLRQRGDMPVTAPRGGTAFTISGGRPGSGRRSEPAFGAARPVSGGRDEPAVGGIRPDRPADDAPPEEGSDDFLVIEPRHGRRKPATFDGARPQRHWMTPVWAVLILCGLAVLAAQGVYVYRVQLANAFPALRPTLEEACARMACDVPYERRIDAIAITGSALRSNGAPQDGVSTLTLEVTLRNTHERPQEWPTLVLDLKDASGTVVVRRNLEPGVWVPAELRSGPFGAGSELTVQLPVSVRGLMANGYQLDKFFP